MKREFASLMIIINNRRVFNFFSSHDYTDSPSDSPEVITVIDSFKSKIIKVRVGLIYNYSQTLLLVLAQIYLRVKRLIEKINDKKSSFRSY